MSTTPAEPGPLPVDPAAAIRVRCLSRHDHANHHRLRGHGRRLCRGQGRQAVGRTQHLRRGRGRGAGRRLSQTPPLGELGRHLVEGSSTYLDVMLVFFTATLFMAIVNESGGVDLRRPGDPQAAFATPGSLALLVLDGHRPHPGRPDRGRKRLAPRRRRPGGHGPHAASASARRSGRRHPLHRRRPERGRAAGQHLGHDPLRRHGHPLRRVRTAPWASPSSSSGRSPCSSWDSRRKAREPRPALSSLPRAAGGHDLVARAPALRRLLRPCRRLPDLAVRDAHLRAVPRVRLRRRRGPPAQPEEDRSSCRWPETRSSGSCRSSRPWSSSACSSRS